MIKKIKLIGWTNPNWHWRFGFNREHKITIPTIHKFRPTNKLYKPIKVRITMEIIK